MAENVKKIINETIAEAIKNKSFRIEILHAQVQYAGTLRQIADSIEPIMWKFRKLDFDAERNYRQKLRDYTAEIIDLFVAPDERLVKPEIRKYIIPEIKRE
jgi:hypothetical protein